METAMREFTCIRCPVGCSLRAEIAGGEVVSVSGNQCRRGAQYARTEAVHPMRTVTSTVRAIGGVRPVVAVKTSPEIPKERIFAVMDAIRALRVRAPVHIGDVLLRDAAGTGADIVAAANLDRRREETPPDMP